MFVNGQTHDMVNYFDNGLLKGKRVQLYVNMGDSKNENSYNGKEGDIDLLLWHIAYTMRYLGMDVVAYKILNSVHSYYFGIAVLGHQKHLSVELAGHKSFIENCFHVSPKEFNQDCDFTDQGFLRSLYGLIRHL